LDEEYVVNTPPPIDSASQDRQHLDLLGIFHYILAGLTGLFSLFPIIHLMIGVAMVTGKLDHSDPGAAIAGWFFIVFAAVFILCGLVIAVLMALAGGYLRQRRHYTFCLVIAAIECMLIPFGTVLGVFTLIVLMRASVKPLFTK